MNRSRYGGRASPPTGLPSRSNSRMSPRSTRAGASERDRRKRPGSPGWRTLTWPYASTTPSFARMRLAITTSRAARSRSVTASPLRSRTTSHEVAIGGRAGNAQAEPLDQRGDIGHVLAPRGLVRAALEPPELVASGPPGVRAPEHVEAARIPPVDRRLGRGAPLVGPHQVAELHVAV